MHGHKKRLCTIVKQTRHCYETCKSVVTMQIKLKFKTSQGCIHIHMYNVHIQCNTLWSYPREDALLQAYNMHCLDVASRSTCQPHPRSSTLSLWHCAASLHCSRCCTFPMHCTFIDTLSKCTTQLGSTIKLCNSTALVLQWFCFFTVFWHWFIWVCLSFTLKYFSSSFDMNFFHFSWLLSSLLSSENVCQRNQHKTPVHKSGQLDDKWCRMLIEDSYSMCSVAAEGGLSLTKVK